MKRLMYSGGAELRYMIAVGGLLLCALFAWWSVALAYAGFILLCLCFLTDRKGLSAMLRHPLFKCFLGFAAYIVLRGYLAAQEFPGTGSLQWSYVKGFLLLWAFFPFAWYLRGNVLLVKWLFFLMVTGLIAGVMSSDGIMQAVMLQNRFDSYLSAIAVSIYCLIALLGFLTIFHEFVLGRCKNHAGLGLFVECLMVGLLLEGLILAQSRSSWLAGILVFPGVIYGLYRIRKWHGGGIGTARSKLLVVAIAVVGLALLTYGYGSMKQRFVSDYEDFIHGRTVTGQGVSVPSSSTGIRKLIYEHGIKVALERPVFGWGPGSSRYVMGLSGNAGLRGSDKKGEGQYYDHFHNFYLELVIKCGVVGLVLMGGYFLTLLRKTLYKQDDSSEIRKMKLFFAGTLGIVAIWSLFDVRQFHFDFRFFWIILAGSIVALLDDLSMEN